MPIEERKQQDEFRAFTGTKDGQVKIIGAGFDVSETCNLACPGCYRLESNSKTGFMRLETARSLMQNLREGNATEIYFLGAEPTLNQYLPQILREAVDSNFKFVLLISNGMKLANESYARQILIPGVSLLMQRHTLGQDALAERIQEDSVGRAKTLDRSHRAWENAVKIFQEKGGEDKLMMQCCLTDTVITGENLNELFRWARETLGTLPIMEYEAPPHTGIIKQLEWIRRYPPLTERIVEQLEQFRKIDQELGLEVPYKDAVSPQAYNSACTMVSEGGQITNKGIFLPCTNMGLDSTHSLRYGNILSSSLAEIGQNEIRRAFIESNFRIKGCSDPCQGSGCWWTGLVTTGCYRLCQLNCVFNEEKKTIDDLQDLCKNCPLDSLRQERIINCGPGTRPGLALGETEKIIFKS